MPINLSWEADGRLNLQIGTKSLRRINFGVTLAGLLPSSLMSTERQPKTEEGSLSFPVAGTSEGRLLLGEVTLEPCGPGVVWRSRLRPEDGKAWAVKDLEEISAEVTFVSPAEKLRIFHADNIRGASAEKTLFEGTYWLEAGALKVPLKSGRWQSFPGLWVRESSTGTGFVIGELSQHIWKHTISLIPHDQTLRIAGKFHAAGIASRPFAAGEAYHGEPIYFEFVEADTPEQAFAGYLQALQRQLRPCRESSLLRTGAYWDSWNDRQPHFWDVSDHLLMRTTRILKERFPAIRSLEVDDGYAHAGFHEVEADRWGKLEHGLDPEAAVATVRRVRRLGAAFFHEPNHAVPRDRFPDGLRACRDNLVEAGFIPAIWLGLNVVFDATLVLDHPDWFVPCQDLPGADPELSKVFGQQSAGGFRVLDPSLPEVREYLEKVADLLLNQWGFEGLKLDFWSYAFENDGFRLQRGDRTAYEWRTWLFELLRTRIAPGSYFTIGCDISTGNPFVCPWVDNVRYGIDIGNGRWENIKYTALVGTFLLHIQAFRFFILNCDSVGLLARLPYNERQVFWAWAVATRSLCELAGDLAVQPREDLRPLQRLLLAPKNGMPAIIPETRHLEENEPTSIIWTKGDNFSVLEESAFLPDGILAVFNWTDSPREFEIDASRFTPAGELLVFDSDLLSSEGILRKGSRWIVSLPPRSARVSHLSFLEDSTPRILESTWRIESVSYEDGLLHLELQGDAPEGLCVYWPFEAAPEVHSSLSTRLVSEKNSLFRITPHLAEDRLQSWTLSLSARQTLEQSPAPSRNLNSIR